MKRFDLITPEGTKDLLFEECQARREVETKLINTFIGMGYSEVVTPGIEFFDVFNKESSYIPQENLYKLSDSKSRLVTIRPDSTIPIARMVATRLKDYTLPLRLFYNQSIYSINPALSGRSDEIVQAGIELIGSSSRKADLEVLSLAIQALSSFDSDNFRIEIGDIGFFTELVSRLGVNSDIEEEIRRLIEVKNYPALNDLLDTIGNNKITYALKQLPRLFGGVEVFEKASTLFSDEKIEQILSDLKDLYNKLEELGYNGKINLDLGIVNRTNYYTGIVFRGYLQGYGEAVLSGGRYDKLISEFGYDVPAIGFGINVDAISLIQRKNKNNSPSKTEIIVFGNNGFEIKALTVLQQLNNEGKIAENAVFETLDEVKAYTKIKGINQIYVVSEDIEIINMQGGADNE
jgi:ATP phosphoribosyltransferase regulatory subunit